MAEVKLAGLSLNTLATLEPRIETVFQRHLANIAQDCMNRPGEKTSRKIILEMEITPVMDPDTNDCDYCKITVKAKSKVPVHQTKAFQLSPNKTGFQFNSEVPENLKQPGLFNGDE